MYVCCECCVLSRIALGDGPILRPEESYRLRCVWMWSWNPDNERLWPTTGCGAMNKIQCRRTAECSINQVCQSTEKLPNVMYMLAWTDPEMNHDKGKGSAIHAMKAYGGRRGIAPFINIGSRSTWMASFAPREKSYSYPLNRELGGPQSRSGCVCWELNYDSNDLIPTTRCST